MNVNAVLMKFFKLPPAMKMILALAGFGSLASILFWVLPSLKTPQAKMWLLIIGGAVLLVVGIIWLIRKFMLNKKGGQLAGALESQGPSRGDIAEQEQIYREKFRKKLQELKREGHSVYKLPWFILMGEPGCGKTASLIHSGLDFPFGKDEVPGFGGTRNYNWWFTNEAIILDTAGRIAFHEEGTSDRPEWEYFLKLLRKFRPRAPLNGLVIALPADKLLRDSSEERNRKATVLRERLRQVHQNLGVRFPTFILVTKMDLVGGFNEFFEEIRVDLQQRNQMFGWSRPGKFQEPYDPTTFPQAFDEVYVRLRDWAMRYLQRKATEQELGLVVTFPESFRALRDALGDYIGTIFQKSPLLEPPFFRGFYFTSAVQEGAPIFDVLARSRHGMPLTERPPRAIDSKAFFIHDFYAKKVFPEQGLIFRSAKHVTLNKRMRTLVWAGSAAMAVMLFSFFAFGYTGVRDLVENPKADCAAASKMLGADKTIEWKDYRNNLVTAQKLQKHYEAYNRGWAGLRARLLFLGANLDVPRNSVRAIHSSFVIDSLLRPLLVEAGQRLAAMDMSGKGPGSEARKNFLAAMNVYAEWYGEMVGQGALRQLSEDEARRRAEQAEKLLTFFGDVGDDDKKNIVAQIEFALRSLSTEPRAFAREILRDRVKFDSEAATQALVAGVGKISDAWKPTTELKLGHGDQTVGYWAEFAEKVGTLRRLYLEALGTADDFKAGQYEAARDKFLRLTDGTEYMEKTDATAGAGSVAEAYKLFVEFLKTKKVPQTKDKVIIGLKGLLPFFKAQWDGELSPIEKALAIGAAKVDGIPQSAVYEAIRKGREDLDARFIKSLAALRSAIGLEGEEEPMDAYAKRGLIEVKQATESAAFNEPEATIRISPTALGPNDRVKVYLLGLRRMIDDKGQAEQLDELRNWVALLNKVQSAEPPDENLFKWFKAVAEDKSNDKPVIVVKQSGLNAHLFWEPGQLYRLAEEMWAARKGSSTNALLTQMRDKCLDATGQSQMPGLGRLMGPDFKKPGDKLPFDRHAFNSVEKAAARTDDPAKKKEEQPDDSADPRRRAVRDATPSGRPADERIVSNSLLYKYHTRKFLEETLRLYVDVAAAMKPLDRQNIALPALEQAARRYVQAYFEDWHAIYSDPTKLLSESFLRTMEKCAAGTTWSELHAAFAAEGTEWSEQLAARIEAMMHECILWWMDLKQGIASDDAVYDLVASELNALAKSKKSVPDLTDAMWKRSTRSSGKDDPNRVFAEAVRGAWNDYVNSVVRIGPLSRPEDKPAAQQVPDLEKLATALSFTNTVRPESPLVRPLLDLAAFSQEALLACLDQQISDAFKPYAGKYPVVSDWFDESSKLKKLADLPTLSRDEFIGLLGNLDRINQGYGGLYASLRKDAPTGKALVWGDKWIKFLYENPQNFRDRKDMPAKRVDIALTKSTVLNSAGAFYDNYNLKLPLLTDGAAPLDEIKFPARAATGESLIQDATLEAALAAKPPFTIACRWSLFSNASFQPCTASVAAKNSQAKDNYPDPASAFELPNNPWSFAKLLSSSPNVVQDDVYFGIPVRFDLPDVTVGFVIAVRVGTKDQPFPGPIDPQPLTVPAEKPKLKPDLAKLYFGDR